MLEKYHLMPNQWDPSYTYPYLIPKLRRDLENKDYLEAVAAAKAKDEADAEKKNKGKK